MKALELLKEDRDRYLAIHNDNSIIKQYNEAIKDKERPVSKRIGNWVQEYLNFEDIKMHLESQFKYPERIEKLIIKSKEL